MLRIPDESEGEFVHLIFKDTIPQLHIIAVYLDGEKGDQDKTSRTWNLLENKVQSIIESGAGVVISGDFNRPLNSSYGTRLLEKWLIVLPY